MMIENQSTIVYVVESSGTFQKNGITLVAQGTSINADLRVSYDSDELIEHQTWSNLLLSRIRCRFE